MVVLAKELGGRIKKIRKAAKLTQEKLAEKTGLSVEYISRLERGVAQPSFKTMTIIAESLSVTIKDFFDFKGPIILKDRKQEASQKKEYIDAILSELKVMEVRELTIAYNTIKVLTGK
ncbi:MAG: helix-turn-helix domain-containing protein [Nitrospirota bacterium]